MQPATDFISVNAIPVSDQISRYFAISECLDHLLCNPSGRWVIGDVEVEHFPAAMLQHQENEQDPQPDGRNGKEVDRHDLTEVIAQKRLPGLRRWVRMNDPENPRDRAFRDRNPEHLQLAMYSRCAPEGIGRCHSQDKLSNLGGDGGSSLAATF